MNQRLARIYLDDHLAVLVGGEALVDRMLGSTGDDEIRSFLHEVRTQLADDIQAARELLLRIGGRASRVKQAAARLGEKLGRLKTNGSLRGYSPLTRLVELEMLGAILAADRALWEAVGESGLGGDDAAPRAARATECLARAEELRRMAAGVALGGGSRRL